MLNKLLVASTLAFLVASMGVTAHAQTSDYRTYFTFKTPVTLPGVTLPAGRYLFRLADPNSSRKVINVLSADGKTSLAMLHTIPNQVMKAPNNPEIRFMETARDMPPAIKTWWYPGKAIGYEFIYPRAQALLLAKVTSAPVLTTRAETTDVVTADLARIDGSGVPAAVVVEDAPAPVAAAAGRAQQGEVATGGSSATAAPDTRADERARGTARTQLPKTASAWPLLMLLGVLGTGTGIGLWLFSRPSPRRI